jgi:hypothetical protein
MDTNPEHQQTIESLFKIGLIICFYKSEIGQTSYSCRRILIELL